MLGTCIQDIVFERSGRNKGNLGIKTDVGESNATLLSETVTILLMSKVRKFKTATITQNVAHNLHTVFLRIALVCLAAELQM
jgi:hypothetical protein